MPELNIAVNIRCSVREDNHRDAIIQTVRDGAEHVLNNVLMLTPSNSKAQPHVTMMVTEVGRDDIHLDVVRDVASRPVPEFEDPFA